MVTNIFSLILDFHCVFQWMLYIDVRLLMRVLLLFTQNYSGNIFFPKLQNTNTILFVVPLKFNLWRICSFIESGTWEQIVFINYIMSTTCVQTSIIFLLPNIYKIFVRILMFGKKSISLMIFPTFTINYSLV